MQAALNADSSRYLIGSVSIAISLLQHPLLPLI
jgi:hypothetical protein